MKKRLKNFDFTLMFTPLALSVFGVVMVYSASIVMAVYEGLSSNYYLIKQIQWLVMGTALLFFTAFIPYQKYQKVIKLIVIGMLLLLIFVFPFGEERNFAKSWYDLKIFSFQPAEVAKLGLIMYLASVYSKKLSYIHDFAKAVIPPLVITSVTILLIVLQPDIGTASIIFLIALSVIVSSGIRLRHLFVLGAVGALFIAFAIPNMVTDERVARFTGAYEPFSDPSDGGYHLIQSYLAIGSGGLTGEGLGDSVQKLGYLSHPHTDFILAVIAEELGLIGVAITVGALAVIVLRGLYIARKCEDAFGSLLAIGISFMIGIQAFINIGSMSGVLPITGVTLPFVSYGGSSLLILMISMGILNNIAMQVKSKEHTHTKTRTEVQNSSEESVFSINERRGSKAWVK
ncbi:cell division protein FtsW [Salinibacillus kushneri]|uniref:Probable peptidoglycan glycosyltransferase FtsW n=1 Tax=Salinibacillus kushneri TaxID=237682 RepID=A0A1I0HT39_9BACI|nr:putative lipid II flippase FtsW [Salinibacillus kushneri]SET86336.1 cell division protein FtsW [Salinibacillus kushneri]